VRVESFAYRGDRGLVGGITDAEADADADSWFRSEDVEVLRCGRLRLKTFGRDEVTDRFADLMRRELLRRRDDGAVAAGGEASASTALGTKFTLEGSRNRAERRRRLSLCGRCSVEPREKA